VSPEARDRVVAAQDLLWRLWAGITAAILLFAARR
jgi:hypothetical protein